MKKLIGCLIVILLCFAASVDAKDKETKVKEERSGSATKSLGMDAETPPDQPGQFGIESSSCTWWWLSGQHSWSWNGIPYLYISWSSYAKSWTEYGTSTGSCGIPLIVDRLYVRLREHPFIWPYNITQEKTGYNTNFVDVGRSSVCYGCPTICGADSYHEAYKSGVTWWAQANSGCGP